jgi:hypothetical protein
VKNSSRKKIIASSAAYILGLSPKVKISGTPNQIERFKEVLEASKDLYFVLQEGTYSDVKNNLSKKKESAKKFHQEFGWQWPF